MKNDYVIDAICSIGGGVAYFGSIHRDIGGITSGVGRYCIYCTGCTDV